MIAAILRSLILVAVALMRAPLLAQQADGPPVDTAQLLQALRGLKEQQAQQAKANKQKALQSVQAAAASLPAAALAWEEAVRQVLFEGANHEGSQFRDWKTREGAAMDEKEVQNAARLHFQWLALTLQRSMGTPVKELLTPIIQHTKEVTSDQVAMDALEERLKHERDLPPNNRRNKERKNDDQQTKRLHDQILNRPVQSSPPAQALLIADTLRLEGWEPVPGNSEGIFQNIILPELRAEKDPRLLEYWDVKIKREAEAAARGKLAYQTEKFTQIRRPELLWNRAEDTLLLGQRNKALNDMVGVIKANPGHPQAADWIARLEQLVAPSPPPSPTGTTTSAN